jgi:hypothetical protein
MLMEKLQEIERKQLQDEEAESAAKNAHNMAIFIKRADVLVEAIKAVPLLEELGFDWADVRDYFETIPAPTKGSSQLIPAVIRAAIVGGTSLYTRLRYHSTTSAATDKGDKIEIEMSWAEDHVWAREYAHLHVGEIEACVLKVVKSCLDKVALDRRDREKFQRKEKAKEALYPLFAPYVNAYYDGGANYETLKAEWKAAEQARVWQPWQAYEIWPAAVGTLQGDEESSPEWPSLLVLESPEQIAAILVSHPTVQVTVVSAAGELSREWITGFWRAKAVQFDEPGALYHRRFSWGDYYHKMNIYGSPLNAEKPVAPPEQPLFWRDYVAKHIPAKAPDGVDAVAWAAVRDYFDRNSVADCATLVGVPAVAPDARNDSYEDF